MNIQMNKNDYDNLINGKIKGLLRLGQRKFKVGDTLTFLFNNNIDTVIKKEIVAVSYCKLNEITDNQINDIGYSSYEEFLSSFKSVYRIFHNDLCVIVNFE